MGTDDFLTPGSDMEVFVDRGRLHRQPRARSCDRQALPGTDVARVDFVTTVGATVVARPA